MASTTDLKSAVLMPIAVTVKSAGNSISDGLPAALELHTTESSAELNAACVVKYRLPQFSVEQVVPLHPQPGYLR